MKRIFFAVAMLIGFSAAFQAARADVSVDFFYNNLSGGSWIEVGDYGYCWQPDVAVGNSDWRPYADGYWAYTNVGWTWVSYEDFGWATYHYGRWAHLADLGWVWVPGRDEDLEWGPAWVSWRTGDQYIGWAPLPPTAEPIYEGRDITGHVDVEFDIGPAYYNFVDVRYIGEPVLRQYIFAPTQNVTYINQTINVTNITYRNKTVYNYGPDLNVVNQRTSRPIQRLTIQHENNVDYANAGRSGGLKTRVQGQSLIVAAPTHIAKSTRQVAPPAVKTKIAKANLDTGWSSLGDAKAKQEYKQKLRSEDLSKARRLDRAAERSESVQQNPPAGAGAETGTAAQTQPNSELERARRGKVPHRENELNPAGAATTVAPGRDTAAETDVTGRAQERLRGRKFDQNQAYPPAGPDVTGPTQPGDAAQERALRQQGVVKPRAGRFEQQAEGETVLPNGAVERQGSARGEGKHQVERQAVPQGQPQGQGQHDGGKKSRAPETTPVPSP